jgi:DNA-binding SARP family transcriptional activator
MLSFSVLGALEIRTATGYAEISGDLQRTLILTLLIKEGQSVTGETLIDEMWGDSLPDKESNALQAHVSRLRRRLRQLEPEYPGQRLTIQPSGYRFSLNDAQLDAIEFIRAVRQAETASAANPAVAAVLLREALAMWRGPVFGGFAGGPSCQVARARYEEHRIRAMELRFDIELRLRMHAAILPELHEAHRDHPLRERFCEQLMLALYRAGRQADALGVYRLMRRELDEELGIEPSPSLQRMEQAVLSHAPHLDGGLRSLLQPA